MEINTEAFDINKKFLYALKRPGKFNLCGAKFIRNSSWIITLWLHIQSDESIKPDKTVILDYPGSQTPGWSLFINKFGSLVFQYYGDDEIIVPFFAIPLDIWFKCTIVKARSFGDIMLHTLEGESTKRTNNYEIYGQDYLYVLRDTDSNFGFKIMIADLVIEGMNVRVWDESVHCITTYNNFCSLKQVLVTIGCENNSIDDFYITRTDNEKIGITKSIGEKVSPDIGRVILLEESE